MEVKHKFSFFLRAITYILIMGHIGIASVFFTFQITDSNPSFIESSINIEKQLILEELEKEIEDQIPMREEISVENSFSDSTKKVCSNYFFNSHHGEISTPPPEFLS